MMEETGFTIQFFSRSHVGSPCQRPSAPTDTVSSFRAVHQQPAGCSRTVVRWERRHSWWSFAWANIWCAPAGGWRGSVVVWGWGFVRRPVDEAFKTRFSRRTGAPYHHCNFIGTVSTTYRKKIQEIISIFVWKNRLKCCLNEDREVKK